MATGPKGQRRPADVIGNAIRVAQIATGGRSRQPGASNAMRFEIIPLTR